MIHRKLILVMIVVLAMHTSANAQQFQNLDFQQKCDTSKTGLCYWDLSWGKKGVVRPEQIDHQQTLLIEGPNEKAVGFVEQAVAVPASNAIQILSISANIKSDSIIGKGAGLNIGCYDKDGNLIATKDMGGFYAIDWIKGNNDWQQHSIAIVVPTTTSKIKIGMILYGKGKVWYADLAVNQTPIHNRIPSPFAKAYIAAAVDTIAKNSLVRDSVNFDSLRTTALKIAGPAKSYQDCFLAINYLLESLRPYGDHHSFFMSAEEVKNWEEEGSQVSTITFPAYHIIDGFGYILVPPFHGGNPAQMQAYADSTQSAIAKLYHAKVKGWIIDLRQNTGGNMEPMIAGLGPLFSAAKLGSLIDVNGSSAAWYYKGGQYYGDGYEGWAVSKPYTLPASLPIAVLTSNQTGSSGEIVVISFIGNAKTRSFGQPTWGLTTGNGSFALADGSQLFLSSTIMADRNGKHYTASIQPDELVTDKADTGEDEILRAAIKWLSNEK